MKGVQNFGGAFVLAAALAIGLGTAAPAAASTGGGAVTARVSTAHLCEALADTIAFLESRPPSRLRDFLLAQAERLFARHCE
jgi:hypothetical protein